MSCGRFWNRSHADFYALVYETARALKRYDSGLIVGAPGVANAVEVQPGAAEQSRAGVGATEEEGSRKGAVAAARARLYTPDGPTPSTR